MEDQTLAWSSKSYLDPPCSENSFPAPPPTTGSWNILGWMEKGSTTGWPWGRRLGQELR